MRELTVIELALACKALVWTGKTVPLNHHLIGHRFVVVTRTGPRTNFPDFRAVLSALPF